MARADGKNTRQRATKMTLKELSGVDRPAHDGASVSLFKVFEEGDVSKVYELTDVEDGHQHLIDITEFTMGTKGGSTSYVNDHSHPFVVNADGSITIGIAEDHTHEIDMSAEEIFTKREKQRGRKKGKKGYAKQGDQTPADAGGNTDNGGHSMSQPTELEKAVAAKQTAETELAKAKAYGELTDEQKSFYKNLSEEDQAKFLEKSAEDREADVAKSREADPVIYKAADGTEFRKSDDKRMVESVKRADAMQKRLDDEITKRENIEFQKRADEELSHLTKKAETRGALLKAVEGIENEEIRKEALEILKSKNESMSAALKSHGVSVTPGSADPDMKKNAENQLDTLAKKYAENNKVSYAVAYDHVLRTEEGSQLYDQTV